MVEPHPDLRLGIIGTDRDLLQRVHRLWRPRGDRARAMLLIVFPVVVSISLLLIADIDAPGGGLIRVRPQNLVALSESLPKQ